MAKILNVQHCANICTMRISPIVLELSNASLIQVKRDEQCTRISHFQIAFRIK
jgi:hypothetical protein